MRQLARAIVVVTVVSVQLSAQERDRSLERISVALQPPPPGPRGAAEEAIRVSTVQMLGVPIFERLPGAPRLGPFTLGTPLLRGEIIRLSLPIGEFVSRGARALGAANRRRQQEAARRSVEADLKAIAWQPPPQ